MDVGPLVSPALIRGREAGLVEKRHLVLRRLFTEQATRDGRTLIDLGTDATYPWFDGFGATQAAISALAGSAGSARGYPSSYGTPSLRAAAAGFIGRWFGAQVDPARHIMISTGASQVFDALSRTYSGRDVLVPELTLSTVTIIAEGNGAIVERSH